MSKLVSIEKFRSRAQVQDVSQINALVETVLESTSLHLEALLDTEFAEAAFEDYFVVDPCRRPFPSSPPALLLTNGFVQPAGVDAVFEVRLATTFDGLATATVVDPDGMLVDYEKGRVVLTAYDLEEEQEEQLVQYLSVSYTSGFEAADAVYQGVPSWLQEMALIKAMGLYAEVADSPDFKPNASLDAFVARFGRTKRNEIRALA